MTIGRTRNHAYNHNMPRPCTPFFGGGLIGEAVMLAALTFTQKNIMHHAATIPAKHQPFAACVSNRESHGNSRAKGDVSSARGRWQFLDRQWRVTGGLTFMVRDRLVRFGMKTRYANTIRVQLQHTPIDRWAPVLQDVAFVSVITHRGGYRHWYIAGSKCNALAVK